MMRKLNGELSSGKTAGSWNLALSFSKASFTMRSHAVSWAVVPRTIGRFLRRRTSWRFSPVLQDGRVKEGLCLLGRLGEEAVFPVHCRVPVQGARHVGLGGCCQDLPWGLGLEAVPNPVPVLRLPLRQG